MGMGTESEASSQKTVRSVEVYLCADKSWHKLQDFRDIQGVRDENFFFCSYDFKTDCFTHSVGSILSLLSEQHANNRSKSGSLLQPTVNS